ncbi:hypothetical protein BpHYR1_018537 [Brachionus plicatilis]|uniref:Uncharacterized protein n=1 Tax=Brachionus plicatilis TaxID=10195 RepID=A0A3M7RTD0_BRAPC|nr:hypothetical protein BpHYR1_018537 [Brachionus plicatilis]
MLKLLGLFFGFARTFWTLGLRSCLAGVAGVIAVQLPRESQGNVLGAAEILFNYKKQISN